MEDLITKIEEYLTEYGVEASELVINLAIKKYKTLRSFPKTYTEEMILEDIGDNLERIAMAAIEIDSKYGFENQSSHSESGVSRVFFERLDAYQDVICLVSVI